MARIDDYKESFRLAAAELGKKDFHALAKAADVQLLAAEGRTELVVPFLGTNYLVGTHPEPDIRGENSSQDVPLQDKILIAHYLLGAPGTKPTGNLIAFRQIPDGKFYFEAFQRRARDPLLNFFGDNGELFLRCARIFRATPVDNGDFGMEFLVFPRICVRLVLWKGDEEFPPDASILFDDSIQARLPAEDIAVMCGSVVYRLIGLGRRLLSEKG